MRRIGSQRGEGKAGCLFWLLILLVAGTVGAKVIPVKMQTMKLKDYMEDLALTQPRKSGEFFESQIFKKSKELGLPVPKDQIKVRKSKERVIMDVQFTVPLDFYLFQHDWHVELFLDRDIYLL
jgi:hypothetical protein